MSQWKWAASRTAGGKRMDPPLEPANTQQDPFSVSDLYNCKILFVVICYNSQAKQYTEETIFFRSLFHRNCTDKS